MIQSEKICQVAKKKNQISRSSSLLRIPPGRPDQTIRALVEIESPSDNKTAADRICAFLCRQIRAMGGKAQLHRADNYGDNLQIDLPGNRNSKPVLLLGHFDTVYPLGTLANMPCQMEKRLHGPGVLDMKSGIALMLCAIEGLKAWQTTTAEASHSFSGLRRRSWQLLLPENHGKSRPRSLLQCLFSSPPPAYAAPSRPRGKVLANTRSQSTASPRMPDSTPAKDTVPFSNSHAKFR